MFIIMGIMLLIDWSIEEYLRTGLVAWFNVSIKLNNNWFAASGMGY